MSRAHPRPAGQVITVTGLGRPSTSGGKSLRAVVGVFGVLAAFAAIEHGIGEILQGAVRSASPFIESWPAASAFEILGGEPAMTLIPNLMVSGVATIMAGLCLGAWAVGLAGRRLGGVTLIGLSILLLLIGGGFGPPLLGMTIGIAALRMRAPSATRPGRLGRFLARGWLGLTVIGAIAFLGLFPGVVLLSHFAHLESELLVYALGATAFGSLILALMAARMNDRLEGDGSRRSPANRPVYSPLGT